MLEDKYHIVRSPRSYNSQIGVPLSIWQMNETHELALIEAGISKAGEMQVLEEIIQPTLGVFTNIGEAHDEGFENPEAKILEKLPLFRKAEALIYPSDDEMLHRTIQTWHKAISRRKIIFIWEERFRTAGAFQKKTSRVHTELILEYE